MQLTINGESHEVTAGTLAALLTELEYEGSWLATALNGEIVPAMARDGCTLVEGDHIEILTPMKGG